MKKITGTITFLVGVSILLGLIYVSFEDDPFARTEEGLAWIGFILLSLCVIHQTVSSKFWTSKFTLLESLDRETEIIKKQIEKRELLAKLENLERK